VSGESEEPEVGSVAEEAAKLIGALSDWAKDAAHEVDSHLATGAQECTVCPICRTVHAVRGLSPEVKVQLASAATSLLNAAAGLLAGVAKDERPSSGFEHIDLDADLEEWPQDADRQDHAEPEEEDR
jgi:hypothetical protein